MLKDDDKNLRSLVVEQQEVVDDLKHFGKQDRLLKFNFDLAAIKRKKLELEQDEERIKKQRLALIKED
jgi:hypothetical protein